MYARTAAFRASLLVKVPGADGGDNGGDGGDGGGDGGAGGNGGKPMTPSAVSVEPPVSALARGQSYMLKLLECFTNKANASTIIIMVSVSAK